MFDFLKGGKLQIDLTIDRQVYNPGDTIQAHITVKNDKETSIQGGRFVIICQQKYQYQHKHRDSDGHSRVDKSWGSHDTEVFHYDFLFGMSLPAETSTFDTSFVLPVDALPTSQGDIVSVAWFAKATIDRKMASDANSQVDFTLQTIPPADIQKATAGSYGVSNEPEEAQMTLVLGTKQVCGGSSLAGSLRVLPQKDFNASEVRLALVRDEFVADVTNSGYENRKETVLTEVKLAGKTRLENGQYFEIPFTLAVPPQLAPTVQFTAGSLKYRLQAILARSMRKDTTAGEEIEVFAG